MAKWTMREVNSGWYIEDGDETLFHIGGDRTYDEAKKIAEQVLFCVNFFNHDIEEEASQGLLHPDGDWELQSTRYRVGESIIFVVSAEDYDAAYTDPEAGELKKPQICDGCGHYYFNCTCKRSK